MHLLKCTICGVQHVCGWVHDRTAWPGMGPDCPAGAGAWECNRRVLPHSLASSGPKSHVQAQVASQTTRTADYHRGARP
jgi:hypothetical protein